MASKIDAIMSTEVALNTLKASSSLNNLTKAVRGSTTAWKAQEAQLKSSGDYMKASEARYEGLGKSIEAEKVHISALQEKMKGLDQTRQDDAKQAVKYGTDLDKAVTALKSMEAQQERAKQALERQKSGIVDLTASMSRRNAISDAYVKRLESEGNHEQALKEKRDNTRKSITDTTAAIKKEESMLAKLKESGASDNAVSKQRIAVEKLKTALNESKKAADGFDNELNKMNPTPIQKLKNSLNKLGSSGEKAKNSVKSLAIGSAIGNGIANGFSNAITFIKGATEAGYKMAEGGKVINEQWQHIGLNQTQADSMIKTIGDIRGKADISAASIDKMQKSFYTVNHSSDTTNKLVEELAAFGSEAKMSGDQIEGMGTKIAKLTGSKTVSVGFFNRAFGSMPALKEQIVKASGMTDEAFNKALQSSKVTGSQLQQYMLTAAKGSGKAWTEFGETTEGKMNAIKGTWKNMESGFAAPLVSGVEKAIDSLSEKAGGIDKVKAKFVDLAKALGQKTGNFVEKTITFIAKNQGSLEKFGGAVASVTGSLTKGAWSAVSSSIKLIGGHSKDASKGMKGIADAASNIASHKKDIEKLGSAIVLYLGARKMAQVTKGIIGIGSGIAGSMKKAIGFVAQFSKANLAAAKSEGTMTAAQKVFNAVASKNPIGIIITAVAALGAAFVVLYKHNKKFRDFINGIGKDASKFFKSFKKTWDNFWNGIGSWFSKNGVQ